MKALLGRQNEQSHADPLLSILELYCDSAVINCEIFSQRVFTHLNPHIYNKANLAKYRPLPSRNSKIRAAHIHENISVSFLCHTKRHSGFQPKHIT